MNIEISLAVFFQALILILLCQALVFLKFKKISQTQQRTIKSLRSDLEALLICARGVGEKLHHQQDEFRSMQERQEKIELSEGNQNQPPYKQIMALMNHGAKQDDMMDSCDLTKGEIELMASLQKHNIRSQAAH